MGILSRLAVRPCFALSLFLLFPGPSDAIGRLIPHLPEGRPIPSPSGARDLCARLSFACASGGEAGIPDLPKIALRINGQVNRSVVQVGDRSQYGREEVWALPSPRGGDCEDLALLKKKLLIEAGLPAARLRIATVLDRRRNSHAVLVLRTEAADYVLDSLTDRVLPWEKTGLSFLRIQSQASPTGWAMVLAGGIFRKS